MNTKTKIVVIHMKQLIIGAVIALALVAAIVFLVMTLLKQPAASAGSKNSSPSGSGRANTTSSENVMHTYTPGVYTSTITLNGNPVDIQVTVDKNNINSIEMVNISDAVTTMYPLIQTNFNEIAAAVMETGSAKNITYSSDNKYTSTMLLNAIQAALDKCTVK